MAVMVDDLVTRGVNEPYRMFTSRSEYRLLLREDNASERLLKKGVSLGLIPQSLGSELDERMREVESRIEFLDGVRVPPREEINNLIVSRGGKELRETISGNKLLKRPEMMLRDLMNLGILPPVIDPRVAKQIEIQIKYQGYIERQNREAAQFRRMEKVLVPEDMDYEAIPGLSRELQEKLKSLRPRSLGQLSRVPGVTPAALTALMVRIKRRFTVQDGAVVL
jgi:tRNA uridine 5-carboxymethylaminomethyl modification enzyme